MLRRLRIPTTWTLDAVVLLTAAAAGVGLAGGHVFPALAGGGGCHDTTGREANGDAVFMQGFCFTPTVLRVEPGTKVTFRNNDDSPHQINGLSWGSSGTLSKESLTEQKFDQPGLYPYACILHPGMVGVIVVGDGKFVGSVSGVSTVKDVKASVVQPAATSQAVAAKAAPPARDDDRPVWLYVGLGALAGVALAAAASGVVSARR
ncbi:MAG: cupredoxin domain-containing protein [Anaerolineaceae bacterium]